MNRGVLSPICVLILCVLFAMRLCGKREVVFIVCAAISIPVRIVISTSGDGEPLRVWCSERFQSRIQRWVCVGRKRHESRIMVSPAILIIPVEHQPQPRTVIVGFRAITGLSDKNVRKGIACLALGRVTNHVWRYIVWIWPDHRLKKCDDARLPLRGPAEIGGWVLCGDVEEVMSLLEGSREKVVGDELTGRGYVLKHQGRQMWW
jgi:hypothetical protein